VNALSTRARPFVRSLVFAVAAAGALLVGTPVLAPLCGSSAALRFLILAGVVAYAVALAPSRGRAAPAAALAACAGALLLALPLGLGLYALGGAALLGVCRSGVLYRARPARAALLEIGLLGAGLALAAFLAGGTLLRLALACWGFWLVQSAYFAVGGVAARPDDLAPEDPFERARARILTLLE
jgi:hypothetical protein